MSKSFSQGISILFSIVIIVLLLWGETLSTRLESQSYEIESLKLSRQVVEHNTQELIEDARKQLSRALVSEAQLARELAIYKYAIGIYEQWTNIEFKIERPDNTVR